MQRKGIDKEILLEAIEILLFPHLRKIWFCTNVRVAVISRFCKSLLKRVVEGEVRDELLEISLEEAKQRTGIEINDILEIEVTPLILAGLLLQNAKQVVVQRCVEAEHGLIYNKFIEENEMVTGLVQQVEARNVYIDLDKAEAILPYSEQIPGEKNMK